MRYTHKYREAAYRPRINKAYDALDTDDKLRVAYILAEELSNQDLAVQLNSDLQRIGWRLEAGTLLPRNESVRELFFPQDTQHDAYVRLKEIMRRAQYAIRIIGYPLRSRDVNMLGWRTRHPIPKAGSTTRAP